MKKIVKIVKEVSDDSDEEKAEKVVYNGYELATEKVRTKAEKYEFQKQ